MKNVRVIARLDVKGPNVVKGIQFECLRAMGKPEVLAENYYLQGADELIYIDIVANLYQRQNLVEIIDKASDNIFIPLTVGGGARTIEDIRAFLEAGADKVAINTAATKDPELIREAAKVFGSQCIVLSIEAKCHSKGKWEAYVDNGREATGLDVIEWAKKGEELGAGEILLSSVDMEGTENGYDMDLVRDVTSAVSIPVIASGGASGLKDFVRCFKESNADAVSTATLLHYNKLTIREIKDALSSEGISVRSSKAPGTKANPTQKYDIKNYNKYAVRHLEQFRFDRHKDDNKTGTVTQTSLAKEGDIGVINCGINNVKSVLKAFAKIGRTARIVETPEDVLSAKCLVLPGVGTFEYGMDSLRKKDLIEPLKKKAKEGTPILGICLGMQLLFSKSEEFGLHDGLGLLKGKVVSLKKPSEVNVKGYKLPHIGWNELKESGASRWKSTLLQNVASGISVYFIHSFHPVAEDPLDVIATSEYGSQEFCVAVKKDNIFGVQFHPEKSGEVGLDILKSFCETNGI